MGESLGLYDLAEASRYLRATAPKKPPNYGTVRRWARSGLTLDGSLAHLRPLIGFEDLMSLRMVLALRLAGFSFQHIRQVHQWLQDTTNFAHPFALKDLWVSETQVFVEMEERLASATREGQFAMEFVRDWLTKVQRPTDGQKEMEFGPADGHEVAVLWRSHPYVAMRPSIQFGMPCLDGTRIPTRSIWSMSKAGDSVELIVRAYGVKREQVEAALEWERLLAQAT